MGPWADVKVDLRVEIALHVILLVGGNRWIKNLFISRLVKLLLRRLGILYQKVGFLEVSSKLRVNFIS